MTAYAVIIRERTTDADALARYRETAPRARETHPMTPIAFYGPHEVLEGDAAEGVAILSFPTMAAARAWYSSPEYQAALPHRQHGSSAKAHYDGIAAFSETDQTEDLKAIGVPTLKTYPGYSHGMLTVNANVINADLLAFVEA